MLFRKKPSKNKFEFKFSAEMLAVSVDDTAQTALELIRSSKLTGNIFYCYVTDKEGNLAGVVPLKKLITVPGETKISKIMLRNPIRLTTQCSADIALEYFILYKFLAFPVVDEHGKLVGIARANDFIEDTIAIEEKTEHERDDLLKIIGIKLRRLVLYEVVVGAKRGLLCVGLLYLVSFFWIGNQSFSLTLSLPILLTLINASFLGCSLPILFKKIGANPAHASCPLVLAIADIISLTSYFSLGTYFINDYDYRVNSA